MYIPIVEITTDYYDTDSIPSITVRVIDDSVEKIRGPFRDSLDATFDVVTEQVLVRVNP